MNAVCPTYLAAQFQTRKQPYRHSHFGGDERGYRLDISRKYEVHMNYWNIFQSLLGQLAHEDELLVARTTWLITGQTLLLIAYVLATNFGLRTRQPKNIADHIPYVGLISSVIIFASIVASLTVYVYLRERLQLLVSQYSDLPLRHLPSSGLGAGLLAPLLLGALSCAFWAFAIAESWMATISLMVSAALLTLYFVGMAHSLRAGFETFIVAGSLPAGLIALAFAILAGARALRSSSRRMLFSDEQRNHE